MRRRVFKLAIFLLLGAIINVAVAWGCALCFDYQGGRQEIASASTAGKVWVVAIWTRPGVVLIESEGWFRPLAPDPKMGTSRPAEIVPRWSGLAAPSAADDPNEWPHSKMVDARGWPVVSMWCEFNFDMKGPSVRGGGFADFDLQRLEWSPIPRPLPLIPIWSGFAINTIFYAAMLWPLISGPFALRRLIRRKRGLCVVCGYDLRHADHAACPECGAGAASAMPIPLPR